MTENCVPTVEKIWFKSLPRTTGGGALIDLRFKKFPKTQSRRGSRASGFGYTCEELELEAWYRNTL